MWGGAEGEAGQGRGATGLPLKVRPTASTQLNHPVPPKASQALESEQVLGGGPLKEAAPGPLQALARSPS